MRVPATADRALTEAPPPAPHLALEGFAGPLDQLLARARAQSIDLGRLSLTALLDQLGAAVRQAPVTMPLGHKADWVVMAAWLVQLRSRLLLPVDAPAHQDAVLAADGLRQSLVARQDAQALAGWLERRPQLGHDVFARGRPEVFGLAADADLAIDVIEFLWACMALFEDGTAASRSAVYRPIARNLPTVGEARARIRHLLAALPNGASLARFLPEPVTPSAKTWFETLRRRSAWATTFAAGLELAKEAEIVMTQEQDFQPIHVARATGSGR